MIDVEKILRENPNGVLATRNGDGVATRIFQFLFMEDGNKVYFCTESDKPVYRQLTANPKVSFCTSAKDWNPVLSLDGRAVFVDDMALKRRALEEYPLIRDIFKTADNPLFKLFYLEVQEIHTFSFAEGAKLSKP